MRKAEVNRILSVVLCVCLAAVFAFSLSYITSHEHHDCIGEHCSVCAVIQAAQHVLKALTALAAAAAITGIPMIHMTGRYDRVLSFSSSSETPQTLKVKLNN